MKINVIGVKTFETFETIFYVALQRRYSIDRSKIIIYC